MMLLSPAAVFYARSYWLATVLVAPKASIAIATIIWAPVTIAIIWASVAIAIIWVGIAIIWASVAIAIIWVAIAIVATAVATAKLSPGVSAVVANLFSRGIAFR
jgi:hypothetical protein